ncbi:hypothetical protein ThimaDRAFT_0158 [Thiocapsa marina 5811]|uniref:Uncharacterized protein n=1 Tax=Thiocapsa marina 5811 TaxID=768671 RepID=F9U5F7_9GAMM|nr:hypothetical protein ThimaDRAFT_0158 [Thiocapsa marina 5811]
MNAGGRLKSDRDPPGRRLGWIDAGLVDMAELIGVGAAGG